MFRNPLTTKHSDDVYAGQVAQKTPSPQKPLNLQYVVEMYVIIF